jgi:RHS repeat-associated protein
LQDGGLVGCNDQNDGTSTEYFGYDGLGSVRQTLDSSGGLLFDQVFDPYGNPYASAGTSSTSWGFTGEMEDSNGLIFLRARYYNPYLNQFIQPDTIIPDPYDPQDWNLYSYARNNPLKYTDPDGRCPTPPPGMGPTICMALFIEPARIEIIPGVLEVHGDNRTFSSNSNPAHSRGYIWLPIKDPDSCGFQMNPSGYIIPPSGDLAGIWYTEPSQRNNWTISSSSTGSITLSFDLVISGILDLTDAAPHINGTITFTPSINGGFGYSFVRDGFPWAEAYYHDGNGGVQTIFQDPAVFGNPYDLFAIEPNISWQRALTFDTLSRINGRPPEMSTGSSLINTQP